GERYSHVPPARWFDQHVQGAEPVVRSDSLTVQIASAAAGIGVVLVPEPSVEPFGLTRVKVGPSLRESAAAWPYDDLFIVTHRALKDVPRVRVVWDCLVKKISDAHPKPRSR